MKCTYARPILLFHLPDRDDGMDTAAKVRAIGARTSEPVQLLLFCHECQVHVCHCHVLLSCSLERRNAFDVLILIMTIAGGSLPTPFVRQRLGKN